MNFLSDYSYDIGTVKWGYFFSGVICGVILMGMLSVFIVLNNPRYKISNYEGMTCINHQNGLTCNWDEWERGQE